LKPSRYTTNALFYNLIVKCNACHDPKNDNMTDSTFRCNVVLDKPLNTENTDNNKRRKKKEKKKKKEKEKK
jgi:hypothetical protein